MKTGIIFLATCLIISSALAGSSAWAEVEEPLAQPADNTAEPEAKVFTSEHEIQIGGKRLNYTATAGTLIPRDE